MLQHFIEELADYADGDDNDNGVRRISIALYYISLLSGLGYIDDQNRNPTKNNKEHLVGRPTSILSNCLCLL